MEINRQNITAMASLALACERYNNDAINVLLSAVIFNPSGHTFRRVN